MATEAALRVVAEARTWIGTPYQHQASLKGVGCDCIGLLLGVWRALFGAVPEEVPAYSPDWGETDGLERMATGISRHLDPIKFADLGPGDIALFRMVSGASAKHCGIVAERDGLPTLIHAWSRHTVAEVAFDVTWRRRLAFTYRLRTF